MEAAQFLYIQGSISEGNQYKPKPGFETSKIPSCYNSASHPGAPCGYTLAVLDKEGIQAWEGKPALRGGICGNPNTWSLSGYIPLLHAPGFYEVRFYNKTIHRSAIAAVPPTPSIIECKPDENHGYISWKNDHKTEQLFASVACIVGNRTYPLLHNSHEHSLEFNLCNIPGGTEARISIRVSDGCRSGVTVSESFQFATKPPQVYILHPTDNSYFDATQPISVTGIARDVAGNNLQFGGLHWYVDDRPVSAGNSTNQLTLMHLSVGPHRIRLEYHENNEIVETSINLTVNELQQWEHDWKEMFPAELAHTFAH